MLVMKFSSQSCCDTSLTASLMWRTSRGTARTRKTTSSKQPYLRDGRPIPWPSTQKPTTSARPVYDCIVWNVKHAPLSDHQKKAWCFLAVPPTRGMASWTSLERPNNLRKQRNWLSTSIIQRQLVKRVPYAHSWRGQKALDREVLQVSDDVITFLESWLGQSAIQIANQTVTRIQFLTTLAEYQEKGLQV